jgi:hypothetical protein
MVHLMRRLRGFPKRSSEVDLPPREIDLSGIPIETLRRVFHAGNIHGLVPGRRHINHEKIEWLQSYISERLDPEEYRWEFVARWVED